MYFQHVHHPLGLAVRFFVDQSNPTGGLDQRPRFAVDREITVYLLNVAQQVSKPELG